MAINMIVATDSRGVGLDDFFSVHDYFQSAIISFILVRGGSISSIEEQIQRKIEEMDPSNHTFICLMGGVCSFTQKIYHSGGREITYMSDNTTVENITHTITQLYQKYNNNNTHFTMTTIAPMHLQTYTNFNINKTSLTHSIHSKEETEKKQQLLEQHITLINKHIHQQNTTYNFQTIRIANYTLKTTKRKRGREGENCNKTTHFVYSKLYDGVHFKTDIKNKIFHTLAKTMKQNINIKTGTQEYNTIQDTDSDTPDDSWDFKRKKNT